ncbi:hypothetical protein KL953_08580 [Mycolicibacterium goodii]|uniref:hypothetical protein n=1 Tax=Mycolicibacterium goodii TaxID=134601 RepID=UPI001BDBE0D7|nr:hypothetical protein [Mycolicibacterium goodii]MBU8808950.1 hypothetical protein [Mycolicibacterium goodii]
MTDDVDNAFEALSVWLNDHGGPWVEALGVPLSLPDDAPAEILLDNGSTMPPEDVWDALGLGQYETLDERLIVLRLLIAAALAGWYDDMRSRLVAAECERWLAGSA